MRPVSRGQIDALLAGNTPENIIIDLSAFSLLSVVGEDAEIFLQGQLSNDLSRLGESRCQLHGYCSAKGRALAIPRVARRSGGFWMLVPKDISESFCRRLAMYVMRAKVTVDIETRLRYQGYCGNAASLNFDGMIYSVNPSKSLYLLVGEARGFSDAVYAARPQSFDSSFWKALDIASGIPQVYLNTMEAFIPQNINMELIDGISFKKGCYPGQEIIARIKYLGKPKHRLIIATATCSEPVTPAMEIFSEYKSAGKSGRVVDAVGLEDNFHIVSAMVSADLVEQGRLTLGSPSGRPLERLAMPYKIPDG